MNTGWRRMVCGAGSIAALIAYMVVSHRIATSPPPAGAAAMTLTLAFAMAPLLAVVIALGWKSSRWLAIALVGASVMIAWVAAPLFSNHITLVFLLEYVATDAALLLMFGSSLRRGHIPLCSRFAMMVRGSLSPVVARYTRQVTLAWTIFFASMITVSLGLYAFAPVRIWSTFANLLALPLVVTMFVAEYSVRRRVLRDVPHSSLITSMRVWWNAGPLSAPPR